MVLWLCDRALFYKYGYCLAFSICSVQNLSNCVFRDDNSITISRVTNNQEDNQSNKWFFVGPKNNLVLGVFKDPFVQILLAENMLKMHTHRDLDFAKEDEIAILMNVFSVNALTNQGFELVLYHKKMSLSICWGKGIYHLFYGLLFSQLWRRAF